MEGLRIPVGELVFDGVADGPADGEAVLLLHGFPETWREWRHQIKALAAAGYRAVAFDQRGYSPDARPAEVDAYRSEHLVADVLAVANHVGAQRFHLVGHDWGGAVAWQVGGRHGERLRTLTVVSTPHPAAFRTSIQSGEQREKSSYMLFFRSPEAEDALLADDAAMLRNLYEASGLPADDAAEHLAVMRLRSALTGGLNWYRAADVGLVGGLAPITTPTMYVWGTDDAALGREAAEATGACVAGPYRFEVLEGVNHWVPEVAAEDLDRLLLEHLASPE